jgi:sialate O-acetylesterase
VAEPHASARRLAAAAENNPTVAEVRAMLRSYLRAFNRHDAAALAAHWSETGENLDLDSGEVTAAGRQAVRDVFASLFAADDDATIDIGEGKDIHPKNKQDVAKRLARWALAETYKVPGIVCRSPRYKTMEKQGAKIVLAFDDVTGGWRPFDVAEPIGFTIAGADKKFVTAKAAISKDGRVEVWSDAVPEPVAVRYAWADNPVCNMYSAAGLPLTPFRTDDFPGMTVGKE